MDEIERIEVGGDRKTSLELRLVAEAKSPLASIASTLPSLMTKNRSMFGLDLIGVPIVLSLGLTGIRKLVSPITERTRRLGD